MSLRESLEHAAAENERSLEGEIRYALKLHARAGWRVHGSELPGPDLGGPLTKRPLVVRGLDDTVLTALRQFANWNGCRMRDEVLHALARYIHGPRIELKKPQLSVDELTAHALVNAIQEQGR